MSTLHTLLPQNPNPLTTKEVREFHKAVFLSTLSNQMSTLPQHPPAAKTFGHLGHLAVNTSKTNHLQRFRIWTPVQPPWPPVHPTIPRNFLYHVPRITPPTRGNKGKSPNPKGVPMKKISLSTPLPLLLAAISLAAAPAPKPNPAVASIPPSPTETKALDFLLSQQSPDGSWIAQAGPGPTAMVLRALLQANHPLSEAPLQKALAFIASTRQPDGGYYTNSNATYNTAIVLATLAKLPDAEKQKLAKDIEGTQNFLKSIQSGAELASKDDKGKTVDKDHPWFGGWGYGQGSKLAAGRRPDLSNSHFVIEALRDSGVPATDPSIQNALVFLTHVQASEANTSDWAKGRDDGGFIYSMRWNDKHNFYGESEGPDSKDRNGNDILTAYGSMTYAGLKSLLYADLSKDDPRVKAALKWIGNNYTLEQNPGLNTKEGLFYYYNAMASALHAYGAPTLPDAKGVAHDWRRELLDTLTRAQKPDGSFLNEKDRWMESNPILCTTYATLALQSTRMK